MDFHAGNFAVRLSPAFTSCHAAQHSFPALMMCRKPQYIAYQVIGAITCITAALAYHTTSTTNSRLSKRFPVIMSARPALLALAAAIPGTQALLHGKCLAMMFVITLGQSNQMSHWFFWVAGFVQASASALWTASLTHGMNVFPTVIVLPILQVSLFATALCYYCSWSLHTTAYACFGHSSYEDLSIST